MSLSVCVHAVIPKLRETGTTPLALYILVVSLLALCLLFSALSILISLYNSVSNPYETYMGPIGVYTCSSLCGKSQIYSRLCMSTHLHNQAKKYSHYMDLPYL